MLEGAKLSFDDEAAGLFGVVQVSSRSAPTIRLSHRINKLIPGTGSLADRVDAYQDRFTILEVV